ncbi:hypothetical protein PAXRUDRAFT_822623 [Paxillus rubicundulus Ve08.2h10]|uniref:non-specific serine/threonine protein kinase n=1 Tax=Paxillus rubicundulus Ve08.2h10 TaxID=930991 RepID=A0A0D0DW99_9AGAM|nr:hypothetical protein PAXRUDRAFT_822623 [Paxillus rubicundulus Ve08.2h10]
MGLMWNLSTFLLFLAALCLAESISLGRSAVIDALSTTTAVDRRLLPGTREPRSAAPKHALGEDGEDITLLDIVLVASVDGKFHAVSRTSGQKLWSMSAARRDIPSSLAPLVRTKHATFDPDMTDDDDAHQELYIIEPQTGDIYVMATPTSPLQPLSFSMSQLVEISPFKFAREDDERIFVGKKETSLLTIELETGKVKVINAECPWDPFSSKEKEELDLDELEDSFAKKDQLGPTEVFIGRTDYHVSIYIRSNATSGQKPPVSPFQNLSFSSYGPNMQDNAIQAAYRRTADNTYIESLPNGQIISFKARDDDSIDPYMRREPQILWALSFDNPIVAVFDVLSSSRRQDPFILMQPRPAISDVLQGFDRSSTGSIYDPDMAYVGLVEETGSLFVMGNDHFPLITFGDTEYSPNSRFIDAPLSSTESLRDLPDRIDSITKRRKLKELCDESPFDKRCLLGKHPLDLSSLNTRQLPGVPSVELPPTSDLGGNNATDSENPTLRLADTKNNTSTIMPLWIWPTAESVTRGAQTIGEGLKVSALGSVLLAMIFGSTWLFRDKLPLGRLHPWIPQPAPEMQSVSASSITAPDAPAPSIPYLASAPNRNANGNIGDIIVPQVQLPQSSTSANADVPLFTPTPDSPPPAVQFVESPVVARETIDLPVTVDVPDAEESEREGDPAGGTTPKKRRPARRRRGKKGKGNGAAVNGVVDDTEGEKDAEGVGEEAGADDERNQEDPPTSATLVVQSTPKVTARSLIVSDTVLGFGSHGTVVFQGSLQGRAVAVKRLLQDFVTLASREVSVLQESDDHPNVIRYYYQESHGNFLYIALELCPASLADVIESPDQHRDIVLSFDSKRALRQITSGLRHLHSLKIVHRDIKPQNILVSGPKNGATGRDRGRRMLISDFGLCKKLEVDQTSFAPTAQGAHAAGTVGWRAPEILRGDVKLDDSLGDDTSQSSRGSTSTVINGGSSTPTSGRSTRLTKAVDIFALGCLFYYVLTNGSHPFGSKFEREVNIIKDVKSLEGLERFGEEGSEGVDLIGKMLDPEAYNRPDTTSCLLHPFFWDPARRLNFLQDASDRFEIMCRDPRDQNLIVLETNAFDIVGHDWHTKLDKVFIENLGKFRKYDGKSVQDLLRALRNKKHHYQDLPDHVKRNLGPMPDGFLSYFTKRFPRLFMHVHGVISKTNLLQESMFRSYFELGDS